MNFNFGDWDNVIITVNDFDARCNYALSRYTIVVDFNTWYADDFTDVVAEAAGDHGEKITGKTLLKTQNRPIQTQKFWYHYYFFVE